MDKFMYSTSSSEGSSLLELLKRQTEDGGQSNKEWDVIDSTQIRVIDLPKKRLATKQFDSKGWRTVNGSKQYSTFRDGKRILAQGAEAFVLSRADAKKSSKKINSEVGNKSNKKQKVQHETSPIRQQEKTDIGKNSILAYTTVIK